jgi:hypothetical protein
MVWLKMICMEFTLENPDSRSQALIVLQIPYFREVRGLENTKTPLLRSELGVLG